MNTPVVFVIFNRPATTRRVLARIRRARPSTLLVIADGPRPGHRRDTALCREARHLVTSGVDWPCELITCFSERNLGRDSRVVSGLNWAFARVERAIVLEDDCLPDDSFFRFCHQLLERYRDDARVMSISGTNCLPDVKKRACSYSFSRIPFIWGWATWRRAWRCYNAQLRQTGVDGLLREHFGQWPDVYQYAATALSMCRGQEPLSWSHFWAFSAMEKNGFHVVPGRNLLSNIGFSPDASFTRDPDSELANLPAQRLRFPLRHPARHVSNKRADRDTLRALIRHISVSNAPRGFPSGAMTRG